MDSRRLVVWISTGILGFQGLTLCFDLLNCTALSWLYVRLSGFDAAVQRSESLAEEHQAQRPRGRRWGPARGQVSSGRKAVGLIAGTLFEGVR